MTKEPLVSVVVPTFNRVRYLGEALKSAVAQTYTAMEIIVSDDGSTENVLDTVISPLGDRRIVYRRNATTLGMGANIWGALRSAQGKYVATLHDDDVWEPNFLSSLVPPLERDGSISVAFCDHHVIDENGVQDVALADGNSHVWHRDVLPDGRIENFVEAALVTRVVPAAMAAVFRKTSIDWSDFPAEVGTFYDAWLTYLSARTGAAGYYDHRRLTRYRIHQASETLSWGALPGRLRALRQSEFMARRYLTDDALRSIRPFAKRQYRRSVTSLAMALFEAGSRVEAQDVLGRAASMTRAPEHALMRAASRLPSSFLRRASKLSRGVHLFVSQRR